MKKLIYLLLLIPFITFTSCKKDSGGSDDNDGITSIDITALQDPVIYGIETFTFRVRGNDNITYTSQCAIFVDGNQIASNTFTPTSAGAFSVYAVKGGLTSPTITITASEIDLAVTSDRSTTFIEMEAFVFTATGSNGVDYTNRSTFYVDDVAIENETYDPEVAGDYDIKAVIGDNTIVSPVLTVTATVGFESLVVSLSNPSIFVTQTETFSAEDNLGRDLSNLATFYVNGTEISSNTYIATTSGDYEVYAIYNAVQSDNTETFNATTANHTTKILVEDYTGTTCVYCPRLAWKLDQAVQNNANIVPIAVHGTYSGTADPYYYENINDMHAAFDVTGAPTGKINRTITWDENESSLTAEQDKLVGLGLAINSTRTGSDLSIDVRVGFDLDYTEELKLVVTLLENGLLHNQANATSYYGGANPIVDFVHNAVLRVAYTDIFGDVIPSGETLSSSTYSTSFNVAIPSAVENMDNLTLVAFVVFGDSKTVINVQKAAVGVNQDFD